MITKLEKIMQLEPGLTVEGLFLFKRPDHNQDREKLKKYPEAVDKCCSWIENHMLRSKAVNHRHSSYGLKHIAEKDIGYIPNGVFIAAAIMAGYPYRFIRRGPNVNFPMAERAIQVVNRRHAMSYMASVWPVWRDSPHFDPQWAPK